MLSELGLTNDQFIDVCIMCGCDYTSKIAGIGAVRALALIRKHGNIEGVLAALDPAKYQIPDPFPYQEARRLFKGAWLAVGLAVRLAGCSAGWPAGWSLEWSLDRRASRGCVQANRQREAVPAGCLECLRACPHAKLPGTPFQSGCTRPSNAYTL